MKKAFFAVFLISCFFVIVTGCSNISGTYVCEQEPDRTLELKSDGTFVHYLKGQRTKGGTYRKDGEKIMFIVENGDPIKASIDGNKITLEFDYTDWKTFVKKQWF